MIQEPVCIDHIHVELDITDDLAEDLDAEPEGVFRRKTVTKHYEHDNRLTYLEDLIEELVERIQTLEGASSSTD